jgi:hypothetical protein
MYTLCTFTETLERPSGYNIQTQWPDSILGMHKNKFFATGSQLPSYLLGMDNGHCCLGVTTDRRYRSTYTNLGQINNVWNLTSIILMSSCSSV